MVCTYTSVACGRKLENPCGVESLILQGTASNSSKSVILVRPEERSRARWRK